MYAQAKQGNPSGRGQVISKVASDLFCSFIFCPCQRIKAVPAWPSWGEGRYKFRSGVVSTFGNAHLAKLC